MSGLVAGLTTQSRLSIERQVSIRPVLLHVLLPPFVVLATATVLAWLLLDLRTPAALATALVGFTGALGVTMIGRALVPGDLAPLPAIVWLGATFVVGATHEGQPRPWAWSLLLQTNTSAGVCAVAAFALGTLLLCRRTSDPATTDTTPM